MSILVSTTFFGCVVETRTYHLSLTFDARRSGDERPNPSKGAGNAIDTRLGRGEIAFARSRLPTLILSFSILRSNESMPFSN